MRFFLYFIFLRLMDIMTTLLGVQKFTLDAEINPFVRHLLKLPIVEFLTINILASIAFGLIFTIIHNWTKYRYLTYTYILFLSAVVANNIFWLIYY